VVEVDARVDDRHLDTVRAARDVPRGREPERQQVLLVGREEWIVGSGEGVADVVQLDGRDPWIARERLARLRGVAYADKPEPRALEHPVSGRAGLRQGGLALRGRHPLSELHQECLAVEPARPLWVCPDRGGEPAQRGRLRLRRRTLHRLRVTVSGSVPSGTRHSGKSGLPPAPRLRFHVAHLSCRDPSPPSRTTPLERRRE
jgi:hypothetical protein